MTDHPGARVLDQLLDKMEVPVPPTGALIRRAHQERKRRSTVLALISAASVAVVVVVAAVSGGVPLLRPDAIESTNPSRILSDPSTGPAVTRDLPVTLATGVDAQVSASNPQFLTALAPGVWWDERTGVLIYVSNPIYSSSCGPAVSAAASGGRVTITIDESIPDRHTCNADLTSVSARMMTIGQRPSLVWLRYQGDRGHRPAGVAPIPIYALRDPEETRFMSVPEVAGLDLAAAEQAIEDVHLDVVISRRYCTNGPCSSTNLNILPPAGTPVPEGSTVVLITDRMPLAQ